MTKQLADMTTAELEAEVVALSALKETEGRTPGIRQAQLDIQQEMNMRSAAAKLDDALAGLTPENRQALLATVKE